jgi:hypothetical protein
MPQKSFNKSLAKELLRTEAQLASEEGVDHYWETRVERLSQLCSTGSAKTHIAFLGTAMLAKALDATVNLYAIKPKHAEAHENSFSARSLCHGAIVPVSAEIGMQIGVTGREPLNNQPYFRMKRLDDGTPVLGSSRAAFDYMLLMIKELATLDSAAARKALRAFIAVRRKYQTRYTAVGKCGTVKPQQLASLIHAFVKADSEHGKRAQAVVAGLFGVYATGRVESGRVNDPSREYPGDVCVKAADSDEWEKAIEVRDKPVTDEDILIFAKKCVDMGVREAVVVMVSERQPHLEATSLHDWAAGYGIGITLFFGWEAITEQVLFWTAAPKPDAAATAVRSIAEQLQAIEARPETVTLWLQLCDDSGVR